MGALAEVVEGEGGLELSLRAFVGSPDGGIELRRSLTGRYDDPEGLGHGLAQILLDDGAADLAQPSTPAPQHSEPVS